MSSIDARRTSSPPRKPIAAMPQENSSTTPEGEEWTAGLTCPGAEERMGGAVSSSQVQVHPLAVPAPSLTRSPSSSFPLLAGASNKRDSSFWRAPIPDVDELYLALSALATLASTFTRSSSASFVAGSSSCRVARLSLSSTESAKAVKQRAAAIGARGGGRGGRGMKQAVVAAPELPTFDTLSTASTAPSAAASEVSASTSSSGGRGVAAVGGGRGGRGMVKEKKMRAAKAAAPDSLKPVPAPEEPLRRPAEPKPVSAFVKKAQRKKERKAGGGRGRF
ncbi:hypothetical protein JCM10213_005962 [Rhodosporidiobolus nylandii]